MSQVYMVISTTDSLDEARRLAKDSMQADLAACVQIIPGLESHYLWEGDVKCDQEFMLIFKTNDSRGLIRFLENVHGYETPELVSFKSSEVNKKYQDWLESLLNKDLEV